MDPLLDVGSTTNKKWQKKAHRVLLQRMTASEMLMHYLDLHQDLAYPDDKGLQSTLCPSELIELVLHESARSLCKLAVACRRTPVPQKWIGSSVALGFDSGEPPRRGAPEAEVRSATIVQLFDWGRSELNTVEKHMDMSDKDQHDRAQFWKYYVGGIDRLLWESARAYRHRFGNADGWTNVTFTLFDFDSMSENDFMGTVTVPLEPTFEKTVQLLHYNGSKVTGALRGSSTLTYSITKREMPEGSRLAHTWRVTVVRAESLPRMDVMQGKSTSDPFCTVTAVSDMGDMRFRQQTSVKVKNLDPEWNEAFDLPVAAQTGELEAALEEVSPELVRESLDWLLPPEAHSSYRDDTEAVRATASLSSWNPMGARRRNKDETEELRVHEFTERLDLAAATLSASPRGATWQLPGKRSGWRFRYWKSFDRTSCSSFGVGPLDDLEVEEHVEEVPFSCNPGGGNGWWCGR